MTVEEIKAQYSMRDVLQMYGIQPNRAGFIHCPFHQGDRTASCKIYPKDFHCHACGANGDIFTFVQHMDNCSFKDAFKRLGGSYEAKTDYQHKMVQYAAQKRRETMRIREQKQAEEKRMLLEDIKMQKLFAKLFPVFSDDWCDAVNRLEYDFYKLETLNGR